MHSYICCLGVRNIEPPVKIIDTRLFAITYNLLRACYCLDGVHLWFWPHHTLERL